MDAIQDAIAKAQAAAANVAGASAAPAAPVSTSTSVAVAAPAGGALAAPGMKMSMDSLLGAGMSVDTWLKVKEFGLLIGANSALVPEMTVDIDMTEGMGFVPKLSIKAGNPPQYFSTTDGVSSDKGGSWADAQMKALAIDPKAKPYRAVDIPMTVVEDVVAGGQVLAAAGTRVGHTTATTNWREWEDFYKEVLKADLLHQTVRVKLGFKALSNANKNRWGVITFKLLGLAADGE